MNFIVVLLLVIVSSGADTDLMCPSTEHWKYRGQICRSAENYVCLWDEVNDNYSEECNGPKLERKGFKLNINKGNLNRAVISLDRYQPDTFTTVGNSNGRLQKSYCNEEGQVKVDNGTSTMDVKCRCDYTCGYAHVANISDPCYCVPSVEDCSCYRKHCIPGEVLSTDYTCTNNTDIQHHCPLSQATSCNTGSRTNINPAKKLPDESWNIGISNYVAAGINTALFIFMVIIFWKFKQIRYTCCREIRFLSTIKDIICIQDEDATFECEVSIDIRPKWYKGDKEIDATDPKYVILFSGKSHQLIVKKVQANDSGVYSVGFKDKRYHANLEVIAPFIIALKDTICMQHDIAVFYCEVSLDCPVKWFQETTEIVSDDHLNLTSSNRNCHQLQINNVQLSDSGTYSAQIRNSRCSSKLIVLVSPLEKLICIQDEDASFEYLVYPDNIRLAWYKGDIEIGEEDPKYDMLYTTRSHKLIVKKVQDNDSGVYSVGFKDKRYPANLEVRAPFVIALKETICMQHEQVSFYCEVSLDGPVTWIKDTKEVSKDDSKVMSSNGKAHQLTIKNAQTSDGGTYTVQFRNSECSSKLIVLETFSKEEVQRFKILYLLREGAEPLVRNIFNKEFSPSTLTTTLRDYSKVIKKLLADKHINLAENDLLFPKEVEYEVQIMFTTIKCTQELENKASKEFWKLEHEIQEDLTGLYSEVKGQQKFTDFSFQPGCLLVTFNIKSNDLKEQALRDTLEFAVRKGSIDQFKVLDEGFVFKSFGVKYRIEMVFNETRYTKELDDMNSSTCTSLSKDIEAAVTKLFNGRQVKVNITDFQPYFLLASFHLTTKDFYQENIIGEILTCAVKENTLRYRTTSSLFSFKYRSSKDLEASSSNFDIKLMICLLRNLLSYDIQDDLPQPNVLTTAAGLSRIKYYRNQMAHNKSMTAKELEDIYKKLSEQLQSFDPDIYNKTMARLDKELSGRQEVLTKLEHKFHHADDQTSRQSKYDQPDNGKVDGNNSSQNVKIAYMINILVERTAGEKFDKEFPPSELKKAVKVKKAYFEELVRNKELTSSQFEQLFPKSVSCEVTSKSLDFSLKIRLIWILKDTAKKNSAIGREDYFRLDKLDRLTKGAKKMYYDEKVQQKIIKLCRQLGGDKLINISMPGTPY